MSGHSKWSKVKHQKAATDAARGKLFTKASQAITIAFREGGGVADPAGNFKLRLAIEKARAVNMPKENIDRVLARASIVTKGGGLETILYEGFGPAGIAILVEAATDNRQRTVSAIRNVLELGGGSLGSAGSVLYLFDTVGIIIIAGGVTSYDDILAMALDAGAMDCIEKTDGFVLYTTVTTLFSVKSALEQAGASVARADVAYRPKRPMTLSTGDRSKLDSLAAKLEELDDVQRVFTNAHYEHAA